MEKTFKNYGKIVIILACLFLMTCLFGCSDSSQQSQTENGSFDAAAKSQEIASAISDISPDIIPGAIGGEWLLVGNVKSGAGVSDDQAKAYIDALESRLQENDGVLDSRKLTEYSRTIIGLSALGKDATDVCGYNLFEPLENFNNVVLQGINGPIWAIIAADSQNYELSTKGQFIDYILENQNEDGGWSLMGGASDTDITAMTITALSPYYRDQDKAPAGEKSNAEVHDAVAKAIDALATMQSENGQFVSFDTETSESCSQVIIALASVGIDPAQDERFAKGDTNPVEVLIGYQNEDGGFAHLQGEESNAMATEQAYLAVTALKCMAEGASLYL